MPMRPADLEMDAGRRFEKLFDHVLNFLAVLACIILALVTLSVCLEVFLRYFLNRPQVWVIELSEYALLYITFLSAAWVLRHEGHIAVDLFLNVLGDRGRARCGLLSDIICVTVSLVLSVHGLRVTWRYFSQGLYNPTILEIPTAYILMIIPIGGLALLIQAVRSTLRRRVSSGNGA